MAESETVMSLLRAIVQGEIDANVKLDRLLDRDRQLEDELDAVNRKLAELIKLVGKTPVVATRAVLTLKQGDTMSGAITVDTTDETVTLAFTDDHGDTDAAAPAGAVVAFTSDNPAVATVASTSALVGQITPVAEGTANIGATLTGADGNPLTEADGTPFPQPVSVQVTVSAGAAVGDSLSLSV
jgi:hypothetical protein